MEIVQIYIEFQDLSNGSKFIWLCCKCALPRPFNVKIWKNWQNDFCEISKER